MKYFLIAIVVFGISYIGYGFGKYYRKRKRFFEDLIFVAERLCVDISFSKDNLQKILFNSINSYDTDLKNVVSFYIQYLKDNKVQLNNDLLFKKSTLIKEEEKETILLFFKSLGRLDALNQVSEINNFKGKFVSLRDIADIENKKYGMLSFKLAILFALLVIVLMI
ncbi:MAG: stage III sporulation protein AB [Clostridia bacterium]|nr:stage III sporulation protein AB [Clostridia bacterium]